MKFVRLSTLAALGTAAFLSGRVCATTVTFDDLGSGLQPLGNYDGLTWSNMSSLDASSYPDSGFDHGRVSGNNVATNRLGTQSVVSESALTFTSAYFTAGWAGTENLEIKVSGFRGSSLIQDSTFTVDSTAPKLVTFDFSDITKLTFQAQAPFAMDNFTYHADEAPIVVPMPRSVYGGLALLTVIGARQLRRQMNATIID